MNVKCRLCLFKTEQDESVNIFTPGKNNELISDTIMSFVPIELSRDDNLPQAVCNICVEKLNSIIEFRMIILNSDAQLKSQKIIVGRLKAALSAAIKGPQKLVPKSENQVCGDSASPEPEEIKPDIHDVKLDDVKSDDVKLDDVKSDDVKADDVKSDDAKLEIGTEIKLEKKDKKIIYHCEGCEKTFTQKSRFIVHDRTHTRDMPFRCDICNKGFPTNSLLRCHHRRIHLGERPFKCDQCTKTFRFECFLKDHKRIHEGTSPHKCDLCSKTFLNSGALKTHKRRHTGEKPFLCEYCSKRFFTSPALKRHHTVHQKGPYIPCPVCGKSYANSLLLKCHMSRHDPVKRHTCETCKKKFRDATHLKRHMRTHSGETRYSCIVCDRKFAYLYGLRAHVKKVHSVVPLV